MMGSGHGNHGGRYVFGSGAAVDKLLGSSPEQLETAQGRTRPWPGRVLWFQDEMTPDPMKSSGGQWAVWVMRSR